MKFVENPKFASAGKATPDIDWAATPPVVLEKLKGEICNA